jgi:ferritin-like metal-binding protein YciE
MQLRSLDDVFTEQVADLLSAEQQLVEALPKVAGAASSDKLRNAIGEHLEETRGHVRRIEEVMRSVDLGFPQERCEGIAGLIKEGDEIVKATGDSAAKDAALIAAAQRVEHYEIAGYGTARALADELGYSEAASLLSETLDEEKAADKKLNSIATGGLVRSGVNEKATR